MAQPRPAIESAIEAYRLKDLPRTGWVLRGVNDPESVADHSWGTALLCVLFAAEAGVDRDRCLILALIHDLAEIRTGDIPRRARARVMDPSQKAERERAALAEILPGDAPQLVEIRAAWEEYDARVSAEAHFVRDMNLIDMCLQALLYESEARYAADSGRENFPDFEGLDEFFATAGPELSTAVGRRLFADIEGRYRSLRERAG